MLKDASLFLCCFVIIVTAVFLSGCSGNADKDNDTTGEDAARQEQPRAVEIVYEPQLLSLLPGEAAVLLQEEKSTLVIDVRMPKEREQVRIPGSVPVSLMDIMQGKEDLPKDKPLLLVCAVGGRSYAAGLYLLKNGYSRLYNLRGGIAAWEKSGLVLETGVE